MERRTQEKKKKKKTAPRDGDTQLCAYELIQMKYVGPKFAEKYFKQINKEITPSLEVMFRKGICLCL